MCLLYLCEKGVLVGGTLGLASETQVHHCNAQAHHVVLRIEAVNTLILAQSKPKHSEKLSLNTSFLDSVLYIDL